MPHFHFDINDGAYASSEDSSCPDAETARREAIRTLTGIVSDALPDGANRDFTVRVWDEAGVPVFEALLSFKSGWIGHHGASGEGLGVA